MIWIGRALGKLAKMDRLEQNDAIPLRSSIHDAIKLYGEPLEIETNESFPDSTEYTFRVSSFHECVIWEWNGLVHCIIYFPEFSYPDPDLKFMFETYGENRDWQTVNQGYLYYRDDKPVSYTHLRAHETKANLVCRLLLEKKLESRRGLEDCFPCSLTLRSITGP